MIPKSAPLTEWQMFALPEALPEHIRRSIEQGPGGCWVWLRSKSPDGYGWTSLDNRTYQAHRLIYRLLRGVLPVGMHLDHLCRVRHCVNPNHLEPVTPRENLLRSPIAPAGQDRCLKCGGEFTMIGKAIPQRRCKPCAQRRQKERRAELRATSQRRAA